MSDGIELSPSEQEASDIERERAIALAKAIRDIRYRKIALYQPHPKQRLFHQMGREKRSRLFMAGNQQGKTLAGSFETACHLTGLYPVWWDGHRFDRPIRCWVGGLNGTKIRDNPQQKLMGPRSAWGTGMIPRVCISSDPAMSKGTTGLIDFVEIIHAQGGKSILKFMSYDMDDEAWESDTLHLIWFDEEPEVAKYSAGMARLTTTGGQDFMTATPMNGMSDVVRLFYPYPTTPERGIVRAGIADALHIPTTERVKIIRRYQPHERQARVEGFPILGSGQVYDTPETEIVCDPFPIPDHFGRLFSLDIGGGSHATAFSGLAHDRDSDVIYLTDAYKVIDPRISTHAAALRLRCGWAPVAYPKDAFIHDRTGGDTFADLYRQHGVKMLQIHSQFANGDVSVEAGVAAVADRLATGRLKVFRHLSNWLEEYRLYHRKEGIIVKLYDDLMDSTRYGVMMIRYASRSPQPRAMLTNVGMDYDPLRGDAT